MKTYIYTLAHPETKEIRYVGKTTNLKRRYYQHFNTKICKKLSNKHLGNWLSSILNKGLKPSIEIIEECTNNWIESEQYWIQQLKYWGFDLLNITKGGEGFRYKHSEESKRKMSLSQKGLKKEFSEEALVALKLRMKNKNPMFEQENKDKISAQKENSRAFCKTNKFKEQRRNIHKIALDSGFRPRARKVIDISTGAIFNTITQAAKFLNMNSVTLNLQLLGKRTNKTNMKFYEK